MEAEAQLARRLHEGLEDARLAARKDVVMISGERAAGQQQLRHRGPRRDPHDLRVDPRPDRVQGAQPLEKRAVGHIATGRPLVHVIVRIDEPGHGDAVRFVDDLARARRRPGTYLDDHAVAHVHPAVLDLPGAGVDQPRFQEKAQRVRSCGRTGTRLTSRPVAARMAATIAGPDEIVGGSPTPFKP